MRRPLEETARRMRNIRWLVSTDGIARKLAKQHTSYHVSNLLELLVLEEERNPRLGKEVA
jgi:hypothetical protein